MWVQEGVMSMADGSTPVPPTPGVAGTTRWARLPVAVRFGLAGAGTQVVYIGTVGAALAAGVHYVLALVAAQVCAIGFAFPVYRSRVFGSQGPVGPQLLAFLGVWWVGVAASFIGVPLLVETGGVHPLLAQLVVMVLVALWGFLGHSRISFRPRTTRLPEPFPAVKEASP
jgi:putative flippase GtrA